MSTLRNLVWFARHSWPYLGCDQGSGRWRARRRYVKGFVPSAGKFLRSAREDAREVTP